MSVVIPTLGRPILERSLAALLAGSHWPARVIVVDQGKKPEIARLLQVFADRGLATEYVPSNQRGRASGVNRGIERVRTRFVAITDDDCLAEPSWLHALTVRLRREPESIVTGRVEAAEGGNITMVVTSRQGFTQRKPRLRFDSLSGGNMGAAQELLVRLGLLDEDPCVATAEDAELAYRALRRGVALIYEPEAGVAHVDWRRGEERAAQYDSYAYSCGGLYGKYLRRGDLFIAARMGLQMLRALRHWLKGSLRRDRDLARVGRAYSLRLLSGAINGWRHGSPRPSGSAIASNKKDPDAATDAQRSASS
jgi:GT2 family glycosyltransferase